MSSDDEAGELWCPLCGAVMYADAPLCPRCGEYVTPGLPPRRGMSRWVWVVAVILAVALAAGALLGG